MHILQSARSCLRFFLYIKQMKVYQLTYKAQNGII
nr:MAG TPA: hypothetical protein [Caudoviricetes sp.]